MKAIFFDLFETLITHFNPDWTPPPLTIAQWLGVEQQVFDEQWQRFDTAWQLGEINTYADALAGRCSPPSTINAARIVAAIISVGLPIYSYIAI